MNFSVQFSFIDDVVNLCNSQVSVLEKDLSVTIGFAQAICAIFALFYIANKVWRSWVSGGEIDLYGCLRPFAIGFLIMNFSLVTLSCNFLADAFRATSAKFVDYETRKSESVNEKINQKIKEGNATEKKENSEDNKVEDSWWAQVLGKLNDVTDALVNLPEYAQKWLAAALNTLAAFLASLISCAILAYSVISRCVLIFFGPFMFAMSLLPGCDGMIMSWIKKYLTYCLYPVIMNVINGVLQAIMCGCVNLVINNTSEFGFLDSTKVYYIQVGISFIAIYLFLSVPGITNSIVESSPLGMGASAQSAASKAISFAGGTKIGRGIAKGAAFTGKAAATSGVSALIAGGSALKNAFSKKGNSKEASNNQYNGGNNKNDTS